MKSMSDPACLIAVMADVASLNIEELIPRNSDVDIVRLAIAPSNIAVAKDAYRKLVTEGYVVCMNYMSSHTYTVQELIEHSRDTPDAIIYVVDTIGCMKTKQVAEYVNDMRANRIPIGLHLHNNLQRAAGTYDVLQDECVLIDGTIMGMGRGSGNLPIELCDLPNSKRLEIMSFYDEFMKNIPREWGYKPEYIMQAYMNCHPNYPSKMMDMGLDTTFVMQLLTKIQDATAFSLQRLVDLFN